MEIFGVASASGAVVVGVDVAERRDAGASAGDAGVWLQRVVVVLFWCVMLVSGASAVVVFAFLSLLVLTIGVGLVAPE